MHRIARWVLATWLLVSIAQAAPPAWIREALKADTAGWKRSSSTVRLLSSETVEYLAPDRTRRRIRGVTRVTQEAGRSDTMAILVYNADTERVRGARAWVISPEGKETDVYEKPQFVDAAATYSRYVWNSDRVMAFPGDQRLGVDGALAWEFEVETNSGIFDTSWSFFSHEPVVRSVFEVAPTPGGRLVWHATSSSIPAPAAGPTAGSLVWEMHDLAAPPVEEPTGFLPNPCRVSVRCLQDGAAGDPSWAELARLVTDIVEPQIVAAPEVKTLATKLAGSAAGRWERIRPITEFVQREVPYLSVTLDKDCLAGYRPHLPSYVLQQRLGDCKDKATLVAAMLRALGDNGYVVLVHAQNPRALSPDWPSAYFNHAIVGIPADEATPATWPVVDAGAVGKLVLFDATDPYTPLGVLPPSDQDGYGLVVAKNSTQLVHLPLVAPPLNSRRRTVSAVLDANANLNADVAEITQGALAASEHRMRFELGNADFRDYLAHRIAQTVPTAGRPEWKDSWDPAHSEFHLDFKFAAERYARWVGRDMMLVNPRLFATYSPLPAWKVPHDGVAWLVPQELHEEVRMKLPEGLKVIDLPRPWKMDQPLLSCSLTYRLENGELVFESTVRRNTGALSRGDYDNLRTFYLKLIEAERRPLLLKRSS